MTSYVYKMKTFNDTLKQGHFMRLREKKKK